MTDRKKLADLTHPDYSTYSVEWEKWRLTFKGGEAYIEKYLRKFKREKWQDYYERKFLTYNVPAAKEAVNEVKNSVFRRLSDVSRIGGSETYQKATKSLLGGVDRKGSTMANFLGAEVLPEMLSMRQVGVWVDMPVVPVEATKADVQGKHPYLYVYKVEDIRSWLLDDEARLIAVLLRECQYKIDDETGLPTSGGLEQYRFAWIGNDGFVRVRVEDSEGVETISTQTLAIREIPFVVFEIDHSLLTDVADMQKSLLNMESTDIYYCVKANFPVYTEQFDPRASSANLRPAQQAPKTTGFPNINPVEVVSIPSGQAKEASEGKDREITLGTTAGRMYPKDIERPGFIHPSPEPIMASMMKEDKIKADIRRSVHLSVAMLDPRMASADSKEMDNEGLHNGLLAIGMALEKGDRRLAHFWSLYDNSVEATIRYPEEWTMQSDAGRRADAKALCELKDEIPSRTAQKEILKQVADKLVGHKVGPETLDTIHTEIETAQYLTTQIDDVAREIELRVVSAETVSLNRGYPAGEHAKALKEQAEQLRIIAISQSQGAGAAARGGIAANGDTGSKDEKTLAAGETGTPQNLDRGEGK